MGICARIREGAELWAAGYGVAERWPGCKARGGVRGSMAAPMGNGRRGGQRGSGAGPPEAVGTLVGYPGGSSRPD